MLVLLPARLLRRLVVLRSVCPSVILAAQLRTLLRHDFEHSLMITSGPPADSDAASRSAGLLPMDSSLAPLMEGGGGGEVFEKVRDHLKF